MIKLYFKLICFSLIFFFNYNLFSNAAVLTEEDIKYIEDSKKETEDENKDAYITYEDIEVKEKKSPFNFFGVIKRG